MNPNGCQLVKPQGVEAWVKNSRLVSHRQAIKHEIELHKWYESERAGYDIGWDLAAASWQLRFGHLPKETPP
jgi:hypothetical protein